MKVATQKLPKSKMEITVEVSPQEMKPFLEKVANLISSEMKIQGFRPGKAPLEIVKQKVGENTLWEEAAKQGLPEFLARAFEENKIEALGMPKVSVVKLASKNPFIFKAEFAVMPKVELGDYKNVKVKRPKTKRTTAKDVEQVLRRLQRMRVKYVTVSRGARKGDRVEIDFRAYLKNNLIEGGEGKKHPFVLGKGQFVPGFEDKLVGMKAEEKKDFEIKFPRDYFKKNLAGRLIRFKVQMNLVQRVEMPALDDEFAKSLGPRFSSLANLKKKLRENLQEEMRAKAQEQYEIKTLKKVCEDSKSEPPRVLVENEKKRMLKELEEDVKRRGGNFDAYLKSIKRTREELKEGWEEKAYQRIKTSLVLREIAKREKVKVTEKEVKDEINQVLKAYPNMPQAKKRFGSRAYKDYIRGTIRNRKVIKMLSKG